MTGLFPELLSGMNNIDIESAELALQDGDFGRAEAILREINSVPVRRSQRSLVLLGRALEAGQKLEEAASAFIAAADFAPQADQQAGLLNKACALLKARGALSPADVDRIISLLERSVALDPGDQNSAARLGLCEIYQRSSLYKSVIVHANAVGKSSEHWVSAGFWLARAYFYLDQRNPGLERLDQISGELARLSQPDFLMLLQLLMRYRDYSRAQAIIDAASPSQKDHYWVREYQGQMYSEAGEHAAALSELTPEFIRVCPEQASARNMFRLRGKSLEATGEYSGAQQSFAAMNRIAASDYSASGAPDMVAAWSGLTLDDLPQIPISEKTPYTPVFMIGFPRSGTTLLETILDTQADIRTLSEFDAISHVRKVMQGRGFVYPEGLGSLTEHDVEVLREAYFQHNQKFLLHDRHAALVIDKLPLNILHIPFILILFPGAKFIFSLRHPLDVCLSCFHQDFQLNDAMYYFTDLQECFLRYRNVMRLFDHYRSALDLNLHTVRYEDLVSDLDGAASELFRFLEYLPDENISDFYKANKNKVIRTPSNSQVDQPLYNSSCEKWRRYADQLEQYIPIVRPHIDQFGYKV